MAAPVVVGVAGSPDSEPALAWAADEASRRGRTLRVLHAYGWPLPDVPLNPDRYRASRSGASDADLARDVAERAALRARALRPGLAVETAVSTDLPATALVAASRDAVAVVVGSRGLGGVGELLLGSVSARVAARAHGPAVVVRRTAAPAAPVVVGVDGRWETQNAVEFAFDQAAWRKVPLVAVHAWLTPVSTEPGDMRPLVHDPDMVAAEEQRVLTAALAGWCEKYPDVAVEPRLVHGRAALVLDRESTGAGLVVVGASGRGEVRALLLGSVGSHLIRHADAPVAVVHPHR